MPATTSEVVSPFAFQCNPHVAQARQHLLDWVRQTGLIRRESARRRFDRADFGWFASLVYPTADRERLELLADWFAWLFLVDDELDDGRIGRDTAALAALDDLLAVLCEGDADRVAPNAAESVAVTALADLWRRTSPETGPTWQQEQLRVHNGRYWNATIRTRQHHCKRDAPIDNSSPIGVLTSKVLQILSESALSKPDSSSSEHLSP